MKLHVMSDLHLEFYSDGGDAVIRSIDPQGADTLVLAGDITVMRFLQPTLALFEQLCERYERVVYVLGNHEYYKGSPNEVGSILLEVERLLVGKLVVLKDRVVEVEGRRFLGGTLWFRNHPMNGFYASQLNDFSLIRRFVPWVYRANEACVKHLQDELRAGDIVITHHLPSMQSCAPSYRAGGMEGLNRFFVTELDQLILDRKPQLWIHGHTHEACDYQLGSTRIVCNPLGYPSERKPFKRDLFIEL